MVTPAAVAAGEATRGVVWVAAIKDNNADAQIARALLIILLQRD